MNFEPVMRIIEILLLLPIVVVVQSSHVRNAKERIQHEIAEVRKDTRKLTHSIRNPRRYSARRKMGAHFTPWSGWSKCDQQCIKSRERYCKVKRKCGHTKHIEEKACKDCQSSRQSTRFDSNRHLEADQASSQRVITQVENPINHTPPPPPPLPPQHIIHPIPAYVPPMPMHPMPYHPPPMHPPPMHPPFVHPHPIMPHPISTYPDNPQQRLLLPVLQEIREPQEDSRDYFVVKKRPKYRKKRKPIVIEVDDYDEMQEEDEPIEIEYNKHYIKAYRSKFWSRNDQKQSFERSEEEHIFDSYDPNKKRNLGSVGESYDYDDGDIADTNLQYAQNRNDYDDEYEEDELYDSDMYEPRNFTRGSTRERAVFEMQPRYRRVYTKWSKWTKCSQKCTTRRYKKCRMKDICGKEVLREIAYCYTEGSFCQQWLEGQIQKNHASDIKPMASRRKDVMSPNSVGTDYILSGKGYRGPEYRPLRLKCGLPNIRSGRKSLNNMLKIIGGKPSRKGEWPWQVVIFNRFKEAFCGGTLIAPRWVLTAAHCVRKVLYVRLGEHNLDNQDGTEMEYRVVKSIKHPNYDKKTVDSDIALLRLPKPVNATSWIGFSCLPRPYQPLPKSIQCTVIGWGKRRNRDQAGTSVLHQAEVPIIPMENCKAVYFDYTITKNMFCAGHKRGRIDTCAGDSGGPLLCRDTTKPNHPWTIFGITSFGDGCAKKNKFGIYAKVPNYVDWIWSVVNCNGNCRSPSQQRRY